MIWQPENVRAFRKHLSLSQQDFGERIGYSAGGASSRISEIERGITTVSGPLEVALSLLAEKHGFGVEDGEAEYEPTPEDHATVLDTVAAQVARVAKALREGAPIDGEVVEAIE